MEGKEIKLNTTYLCTDPQLRCEVEVTKIEMFGYQDDIELYECVCKVLSTPIYNPHHIQVGEQLFLYPSQLLSLEEAEEATIASFQVDHTNLPTGIYNSREDTKKGQTITTFDIRVTVPNEEPAMSPEAMHTIEHLLATHFRNKSKLKDDIIYFGPMGCKTGFYLIVFDEVKAQEVVAPIKEAFEIVSKWQGAIPGATPKQCGNYTLFNLNEAKYYANLFLDRMKQSRLFRVGHY